MTIKYQTITESATVFGASTITPIDRFTASTATEPVYNLLTTTEPCTII